MKEILDTATPALQKLIDALTDKRAFFKTWAQQVVKFARRNARTNSKGGDFWKGIAGQTKITAADNSGATVECLHFAGAHKHFGGVIRARNAGALTIPLPGREAEGKRAAEFTAGGRQLFVAPGTSVLGYSDGSKFCGLFALRKAVTQKPEPWWPEDNTVLALGIKEADYWLNT